METVSKLSVIGAPTRALWMALVGGVWRAGDDQCALRMTGALIVAAGLFGVLWPSMHQLWVAVLALALLQRVRKESSS